MVTSDGQIIEAQRFYHGLEGKLGRAQRAGKKRLMRTVHAKIKNRRKDFLHKLSTRLIRENHLVVVGNVSASALAKTRLAKSVLDAGWSMLRTFLKYKAMAQKVCYIEVNEAYTSQTCSACGARTGPQGNLSVREWTCSQCGTHHHRDVNAARQILRLGHQALLREESHGL